jgi:hypothetical protein
MVAEIHANAWVYTLLFYGAEYYLRGHHSIVSQHPTEPEGSSPHSQVLSNCPYPEPHQSSTHNPILYLQDASFTLNFSPITYMFFSTPFMLYAWPISPSLTWPQCSSLDVRGEVYTPIQNLRQNLVYSSFYIFWQQSWLNCSKHYHNSVSS